MKMMNKNQYFIVKPCEDAVLEINGTETISIPSGDTFDLTVTLDGLEAGTYNEATDTWEVESEPCADATYTIKDSANTTLYSGSIASGSDLQQTVSDSTVNVRKSDNTLISAVTVEAQATDNYLVADSTVNVRKSDNTLITAVTVKATDTVSQQVSDSSITVNGNAYANVKATDGLDVAVEYENGTPVGTINGSIVEIPNPIVPSGIAYCRPQPTGQITSYRTGDDAWAVINRPPPANPANPVYWAELLNFTTLVNNNIFGNTDRFTDELGGQTYTNGYIIDNYTGLGWNTARFFLNWDDSIDNPLSFTDALGNSDYFSPNILQANSIFSNDSLGFNYAPFNIFWSYSNQFYNTSTTSKITVTNAMKVRASDRGLSTLKSNSAYSIICRNHF